MKRYASISAAQPFLLVLWVFFIPISPSLKSIIFPLALLTILLDRHCRMAFLKVMREPAVIFAILFVIWVFLSCFWSPDQWPEKTSVFSKMAKLVYLPILAAGFYQFKTRQWALHVFLLSILITVLISIYLYAQSYFQSSLAADAVFNNRIKTGLMVALASWLTAVLAMGSKGWLRFAYLACFTLFTIQVLFINTSRTGYLIYFILTAIFILQNVNWKFLVISIVLLPGLLFLSFQNPTFKDRSESIIKELIQFQKGKKDSSIGYRIQFHQYAYTLVKQNPLFGHGAGGFTWNFAHDNPIPSWGPYLFDPHSQYWLIAVDGGLIGLALFLCFLFSLLLAAWNSKSMRVPLLMCFISIYMGNITDSLIFYSTTGFLFLMFAAMSLGEKADYQLRKSNQSLKQVDDMNEFPVSKGIKYM